MADLTRVVANLHTPAIAVVLRAVCDLVEVLAVRLALVEDVVDIVGKEAAIDADVRLVVHAA